MKFKKHSILSYIVKLLILTLGVTVIPCADASAGINDGLVAYYPFKGNADDESGNGNHGTVNGATLTTDRFGNANSAYSFDGADDYIEIADDSSLDISGAITLAAWIKLDTLDNGMGSRQRQPIIQKYYSPTGDRAYELIFNDSMHDSSHKIQFTISATGTPFTGAVLNSSKTLQKDVWYHIAAVFEPNTSMKIYINGSDSTGSITAGSGIPSGIATNNLPVIIGKDTETEGMFYGTVDEIRIYNRALSGAEIQELYEVDYGLVAYYPFNGNANDESGNGNNGTVNGATLTTDRFGNANSAFAFDGIDDYIDAGNDTSFDITNAISITAWVKFNIDPYSISQGRSYIVDKDLAWRLWYSAEGEGNSDTDQVFFDLWDWEGVNTQGINWQSDTWYHIAATYDGAIAKIYINGNLNNSTSLIKTLHTSTRKLCIGSNSETGGGSQVFNGAIDNVRIYNRALSEAEIQELYGGINRGLVAYYPFNGNANDESGNGNHGTVNGATLAEDRFGNPNSAYSFDGVDDFIEQTAPNNLPLGNTPRTISAWIKSYGQTAGNKYQTVIGYGNPGTNNQAFSVERGGDPSNQYYEKLFVLGWSNNFSGNTPIEFNNWYYVTVTFDGTDLKLYLNGQLDGSKTTTYNTVLNAYGLRIGLSPPNDGWHMFFNGIIDDVRIYNRALSESEIQELAGYISTISGNITCADYTSGSIFLRVYDGPDPFVDKLLRSTEITEPGPYTVEDVPILQEIWISAFWDKDGSGGDVITVGDYKGWYSYNPIILSEEGSSGVDINIDTEVDSFQIGLVAYYPFNGNADDESGNGNHGTVNGAALTTDRFGNANSAYIFDGVDDFIEVTNQDNNLSINGAFTLCAWVKPSSGSLLNKHNPIIWKIAHQYTNEDNYYLSYGHQGTSAFVVGTERASDGMDFKTFSGVHQENSWYHIIGVYDGNNLVMYINGVQDGITAIGAITPYTGSAPLRIGNNLNSTHDKKGVFNGTLDDIRIYNRSLSETEIQELYVGLDYGLVTYYPFNGNANDESGNGNNGTVNGAALTTDRFGNANSAYSFDGVDDYIGGNFTDIKNVTDNFTMALWVYPRSAEYKSGGRNWTIGAAHGDYCWGAGHAGAGIAVGTDKVRVYEHATNYIPAVIEWQGSVIGWTHVVVVYNSKTPTLYINGELAKVGSLSPKDYIHPGLVGFIDPPGQAVCGSYIGTLNTEFGSYGWFDGSLDEIRIYNRALSEAEIEELYGATDILVSENLGSSAYTASGTYNSYPYHAFDGDWSTMWNAGSYPVQWIEVDLGRIYQINRFILKVAQTPGGYTTHQILLSNSPIQSNTQEATIAHTFSQSTGNNQVLEATLETSISARYVQVRTLSSPSWVAWYEIQVYALPPAANPIIISSQPKGIQHSSVDHLDVTFSQEINSETFTTDDVDMTGPEGSIDVDPPQDLGGNTWRISFPPQSTEGEYHLYIGPHIEDFDGNEMDQDLDGTPGELEEDKYHAVVIFSTPKYPNEVFPTLNPEGNGSTITLEWIDYDESVPGGGTVISYRIYQSENSFTDFSDATLVGTTSAKTYTATGLSEVTTYFFAVAAVTDLGVALSSIQDPSALVSGTPIDTAAPEEVRNLTATSSETSITFNWLPSLNTLGDLADQKLYFNNDPVGISLGPSVTSYTQDNLNPETSYSFRITVLDDEVPPNESAGVTITAATLLTNPVITQVNEGNEYVDLVWNSVSNPSILSHYNIYYSTSNFSNVSSMTPALNPGKATSARVRNLTNSVTYYFAITAVNISGGESKSVQTTPGTPQPDTQGPVITNVKVNGVPLVDGYTLHTSSTFTLNASDPVGVSRVEFKIDGALKCTDYNPTYSCYWDIATATDGNHTLTIVAYDSLGNSTTLNYNLVVVLSPPAAPVITQPASGSVVNTANITVSGQATNNTEVILYKNTVPSGSWTPVATNGTFSLPLTLSEGENRIRAAARNRAGSSPQSNEVLVTLDTTIPKPPAHLSAKSMPGGVIRLTWGRPLEGSIHGYNLYRSEDSFTSSSEATKVNSNLISVTSFDDLPANDGTYYYRASSVNYAGTESDLSNITSAAADSSPPRAVSISYTPQGPYDPVTGRIGPGMVNVLLTVNEPLQMTPFLSLTPSGGIPISVDLTKESNLEYSGFFVISDTTPSGTAYAVFSGRDLAGNRGTEIDDGSTIEIGTAGPAVVRITVQPDQPIRNDENNPVSVNVTIGLDGEIKSGETPQLSYLLSGAGREPVVIDPLTKTSVQPGEDQAWQGTFTLPADAGLTETETFQFVYEGMDDLDNVSTRILTDNLFQVYQGDLPPLDPPDGLQGESLPAGKIKLTWDEVEGAAGYQLYRKAPGESLLTAYQRLGPVLEYTDEPSVDGLYTYAVASIRQENAQEAISGMCNPVELVSDATPPGAPLNLVLEPVPQGIKLTWEANPNTTEPITYALYRSSDEILSVEGLEPLARDIPQLEVIDPTPSQTQHYYAITAIDQVGNESEPSNSVYHNITLLPVSSLNVLQEEDGLPVVSWTHPGGDIAGYDIYSGPDDQKVKLNEGLLAHPPSPYTDTGYAGDERRYTVVAVDSNLVESLPRSITLPVMNAFLAEGSIIKRGIMNHLEYQVENSSASAVDQVRLKVNVGGRDHLSEKFSIEAGTEHTVSVTVGGYSDLLDSEVLTTTIEIEPNPGEKVEIVRSSEIEVRDGMLVLNILNDEFSRGATGSVWFALENTGEEEIEIITARNSGASASNEVIYYLLDQDENVLTSMSFKQNLGENVVTLSNGYTVARIPPGETFTSQETVLNIPGNAPDQVTVKLDISNIYFHQGREDQVTMEGLSTRHDVSLVDTSYFGEVLTITPETSNGDEDIIITGHAVERETELPMPEVPLDLVISVNGFERSYDVFTDDDGTFSFTFTPLPGESGLYSVWAVHPDLTDRAVQAQFVISKVFISPLTVNLNIPRDYEQSITIMVTTGEGTEIHNLHLTYDESDQPGGVFPPGVEVIIGPPVDALESGKSTYLGFTVEADDTANDTGTIYLKVISDETGSDAWGTVTVNMQFSEAQPELYYTPDHIETGVALDESVTETVVLGNRGLADLEDVTLALIEQGGTPAPDWVSLNSPADQENIAVGEERETSIFFSPSSSSVAEGMYTFYLRVSSSNYPDTDILLFVAVTQSGIGNVLFKIADIYTGTVDPDSGEIIQGLAGARITAQNEEVLTIEETQTTDEVGEALFSDLPAGRYKCRITANNHQEYIGRFWIKPGITDIQDIFLEYNLVTVEWEVVETTVEDVYEIILVATYETDVPAAVVVAEPASVTLPEMKTGDVYYGEFTLTNYGLIRADNVYYTLPEGDQNFTYELLSGLPDTLDAKERITVPYRVVCVQSPYPEGDSSGGGCHWYFGCIQTYYQYVCVYGRLTPLFSAPHCTVYNNGECGGGSGGGGIGPGGGGSTCYGCGGGDDGGGGSSWDPDPNTIDGVVCWPVAEWSEAIFDINLTDFWDTLKDRLFEVGCSVDCVHRKLRDDAVDLSVKVPGGTIDVKRLFYENEWNWEHKRNNLQIELDPIVQQPIRLIKDLIIYELPTTQSQENLIYVHDDTYKITGTGLGYLWEDKLGNWKEYDLNGRMTSYGTPNGTVGKLFYETGENGKLIGIADRNDRQVIWFEYDGNGQMSAARDNVNRRVEYDYTNGHLTKVTDVLTNETAYEYDNDGRLTRKVDAGGRPTIVSYDSYGNVSQVVDQYGVGQFFQYYYDEAKKEYYAQIKTSSGMIKEVWYDRDGETKRMDINGRTIKKIVKDARNLIITDEKGNITRKEFDEWENLTRVIYPDGSASSFEYEHTFNRMTKVIYPRGNITEYQYDNKGNLILKKEAVGTNADRVNTYTYDEYGQLLTATILGDTNTVDATTTFTYYPEGKPASIMDPEGNRTEFLQYDNMGNVEQMKDPRNNIWNFDFDDMGRLVSQTDPENNVTTYEYDGANNRTALINADLKRFEFEYDDHNNRIKTKDPYEKYVATEYNTDNLPVKVIDQEGKQSQSEYDNEGRLIKAIDGAGNETLYQYDESQETLVSSYKPVKIDYPTYSSRIYYDNLQRVIQETDILDVNTSYSTAYTYDSNSNVVSVTDEEGNTTQYEYDALNRLIKTTDSLGGVTERTYDDRGNVIKVKDPNNGITRYEYDRNNRLVKVTQPMGEETSYEYDAAGNRTTVLDVKGQKISYEYDELNRPTAVNYFATGDHTNPIKAVTFTYDKLDNLIYYDDGTTSATYSYDDLSRKTIETIDYGPFTLSYSYTYYDNSLKKSFIGPNGITYEYAYDSGNRISGIDIPGQGQITYNNYQWNSPAGITLPGGSTEDYTYDSLMQVTSIVVKDSGQNLLMDYIYAYSPAGNVSTKNTEHGNYVYGYDKLYRLTEALNPTIGDESYTYDPLGNRLTSVGAEGTWAYNLNNQLLSYASTSFDYDDNGNLIQKVIDGQTVNYIYNVEDRIIRVEDASSSVIADYYYDPFGRRLWKDLGGIKTYFLYADEGLIGEYDAAGDEIKTYGYAPGSIWTTDPIFQKVGMDYYWYENDHLGTPQRLINTSGEIVWSATYDAFGNIQVSLTTIENNLLFPGQYYDAETRLYYNWNRYYDPDTGRYLRKDPEGNKDSLNLYSYVIDNPLIYMDPLGLCKAKDIASGMWDWYLDQAYLIWHFWKPRGDDPELSSGTYVVEFPEIGKGTKPTIYKIINGKNVEIKVDPSLFEGDPNKPFTWRQKLIDKYLFQYLDPGGIFSGNAFGGDILKYQGGIGNMSIQPNTEFSKHISKPHDMHYWVETHFESSSYVVIRAGGETFPFVVEEPLVIPLFSKSNIEAFKNYYNYYIK